jgi:hypothetical protein
MFKENGTIKDHLRNGNSNTVEIKSTLAKTMLFYIKRIEDTNWKNIPLNNNSNSTHWKGIFPSNLAGGYYNARVIAVNPLNDSLVYSVDPAFVVYSDSCNPEDNGGTLPEVVLSCTNNRICTGDKTSITATGANMYEWSTGTEGNSLTVSSSGIYSVLGTNLNGCTDTASISITANPAYEIVEDKIICHGKSYKGRTETGSFTENFTTAMGCDSIVTTNLTVNPPDNFYEDKVVCENIGYMGHTTSGLYIEYLKSMSGCDSIVNVNLTVISNPPKPEITFNNNILYSDASEGNQWYFENNVIQNAVNNCIITLTSGRYFVVVTENSCSSFSDTLYVNITDIDDVDVSSNIDIYPNPTQGMFDISVKDSPAGEFKICIYNNLGTEIQLKMDQIGDNVVRIDLSNYPQGIYIVKIYNESWNYISKVIKF